MPMKIWAGAVMWMQILTLACLSATHHNPTLEVARYGTFSRLLPKPDSEWPWTEITFYTGELVTVRRVDATCEDVFGHGVYEQRKDTLIIRNFESCTTLNCTVFAMDNLIIPEKRYLVRPHGDSSFQIRSLAKGYKVPAEWTTLWRYGAKRFTPTN